MSTAPPAPPLSAQYSRIAILPTQVSFASAAENAQSVEALCVDDDFDTICRSSNSGGTSQWLRIDFGTPRRVEYLSIYNIVTGSSGNLRKLWPFSVKVGNTAADPMAVHCSSAPTEPDTTYGSQPTYREDWAGPFVTNIAGCAAGLPGAAVRFVTILLPGNSRVLNLREVELWEVPPEVPLPSPPSSSPPPPPPPPAAGPIAAVPTPSAPALPPMPPLQQDLSVNADASAGGLTPLAMGLIIGGSSAVCLGILCVILCCLSRRRTREQNQCIESTTGKAVGAGAGASPCAPCAAVAAAALLPARLQGRSSVLRVSLRLLRLLTWEDPTP
jgi:hypothetical protein